MIPLLSSSNLGNLAEIKSDIRCLLIASCNEEVTLHQLSVMYEKEMGESIPFKDFNYPSLKEFLLSIPDAVYLSYNNDKKLCVHHVESEKSKHVSSLVSRTKVSKKPKKSDYRAKLYTNSIDPKILKQVMTKVSCAANKGRFSKVDLLSEINSVIGDHSVYTIHNLNAQLNELHHILTHDDQYIRLKNGKKSGRKDSPSDFIKDSTKERLRKLADKYQEGIWVDDLPKVYSRVYGLDLEYKDLGFNDIVEFVSVLPDIFRLVRPTNSSKSKVISRKVTDDQWNSVDAGNSVKNLNTNEEYRYPAVPNQSSPKVSKQIISREFMSIDDTIKQLSVEDILKNSSRCLDVTISEIYNPSFFWIIPRKKIHRLISLMDHLQQFYAQQDLDKYRIMPTVLQPGLHVACTYSRQWHRGIIKSVGSNSVTILFYDFGTMKDYKANQLYFLDKTFSVLPAQAIPCSLYNVKPIDDSEWSKASIDKFLKKVVEKDFVASVFGVNQENNSLAVELYNISKTKSVYITEWMVSHGLAEWGSYNFEIDNFMYKYNKDGWRKIERKPVQTVEEPSKVLIDVPVETSDYVRRAKQLEALKKYKTRFRVLDSTSISSDSAIEKRDSLTSISDSSEVIEKSEAKKQDIPVSNSVEKFEEDELKRQDDLISNFIEKLQEKKDNAISDFTEKFEEKETEKLEEKETEKIPENVIPNSTEKLEENKAEERNNAISNNVEKLEDNKTEKQDCTVSDSSEKQKVNEEENKLIKTVQITFKEQNDHINFLNFASGCVATSSKLNSPKEKIVSTEKKMPRAKGKNVDAALKELQKLISCTKL